MIYQRRKIENENSRKRHGKGGGGGGAHELGMDNISEDK